MGFAFSATGDFEAVIEWQQQLKLWGGSGVECGPFEAVKDFKYTSSRKRRVEQNSSGGEEEGRSRGPLTDGLSEWIIDRVLLTDAGSINSSKAAWWITADKQCWVSKCVFNKDRWKYYSELRKSSRGYNVCFIWWVSREKTAERQKNVKHSFSLHLNDECILFVFFEFGFTYVYTFICMFLQKYATSHFFLSKRFKKCFKMYITVQDIHLTYFL